MYQIRFYALFMALFIQFCFIQSTFSQSMGSIASEESVIQSCSLSIKIIPTQPLPSDPAAKAEITVTVLSRDGIPVSGNQIELTANAGTFNCTISAGESESDDNSCFSTNQDGKAIISLINLPFNKSIKVKASTQCGDYVLTASGSAIISKKVIKKK
ncbi:MAG TPA: hypothetical protein VKO63_06790 [Chitinispirillaceae bacterium]|nr:hypothetical protein [Chitinispirillaceae bacterium]